MPYAEYWRVFAKRWWMLPLVALVAAGVAFAYSRSQQAVYRSTSKLLITPGRPDLGQQLTVEKQLRPIAQRVKTTDIARQVDEVERLDLGAERLLGMIRVEAIIDQGYVQIDADDVDPERAERVAGAFAQVYAQQHAAADVGKPQAERLFADVLDRPSPATQIAPRTNVVTLGAALVGLFAAILLIFGLEYFDNTLKTGRDVEEVLGLSTLGLIPRDHERHSPVPKSSASAVGQRGNQGIA